MLLLVAIAAIIVAYFVFRATRSTSTATSPPHATAVTKHRTGASHHAAASKHPTPAAPTEAQIQAREMKLQRKRYAARIVPVLDRSTRLFDGAARAVASVNGNFNKLQQTCSYWGGKVLTIDAAYEGIPHPYPWYSPTGTLHHQVSGVFHYMLGAIQNCQEAVQATDSGASSTAVSQMATAARNLHNLESYARYLALH